MAHKNKRKVKTQNSQLANLQATAKRIESVFSSYELRNFIASGTLKGYREKLVKINTDTIRNIVDRIPLINAIINTRIDQILRFTRPSLDPGDMGFRIRHKNVNHKENDYDKKRIRELTDFIVQTGLKYDPEREDDFSDFTSMFQREILTVDQMAIEIQRNVRNEPIAYWLLDGATIKRIDPLDSAVWGGYKFEPDTRFAQIIDEQVYNEYSQEELIFAYKGKRVDIRFRGFGYSPVEQAIDVITTLLFGYNYVRDQLLRDRVPKGFISVMGDVGRPELDNIREYWYAAMSGAGGQWSLPILPSGKDGVGIDFKLIGQNNKDMEYHKLMMFISSIVAAVFSIDLAELGIKADDSTALIGETAAPRIEASKDRGLKGLLDFQEQQMNKIIQKVDSDYIFEFTGYEKEDETQKANLRESDLRTMKSINQIRREAGEKPIKANWAKVVLNPLAVQLYTTEKQAKQAAKMGGMGAPGGQGGAPGGAGLPGQSPGQELANNQTDKDQTQENMQSQEASGQEKAGKGESVDWEKLFSKSMTNDEKVVRVVIE